MFEFGYLNLFDNVLHVVSHLNPVQTKVIM